MHSRESLCLRLHRAFPLLLVASFLVLGATGCSNGESLYPVQGKVLFNNQPLPNAVVTFVPEVRDKENSNFPVGKSGEDGTFTVKTGDQEGAKAGKYKVTVVCLATPKPSGETMAMGDPEPVDRLSGMFANPATTKLSAEIKEGDNQLEPFALP